MAAASIDPKLLQLVEIVLTAEAVNSNPSLDINDLPTEFRPMFCPETPGIIARPITIKEGILKNFFPDLEARSLLKHPKNSYLEANDLGQFSLTAYGPALKWYFKQAGVEKIMQNPALTLSLETAGEKTVSYTKAREQIHRFEDTTEALTSKINAVVEKNEEMKAAVELVIPYAPDEIEFSLNDLVYDENQLAIVNKIEVALKNQSFLKDNRIYDVGKVMLVGKPGTGKTSYALAVAKELHMPLLEVRLSMITSQYLGETAKNIDRIFTLAKRISPCILFIDEFDYIAKTRISDDNGTMKRAVNTLLKCLDYVSLIRDKVLFIGATNFAETLDEAVWRRITEVVKFEMPDENTRREILEHVARNIAHSVDFADVAELTDGFSGADLRMMLTEAIVHALLSGRKELDEEDITAGISLVERRMKVKAGIHE
ncbi:MAG TPA: ATP-binding protein [Methanocorpusculum sp.]|nr:ATP-binding protein [Methanocorpusculum sp.]HJJ39911.1 ATP-binding protein [Methanocorpusculum sp.]HJJ49136.1 ATP-binding protein [Methanocorpusculum sp.]HJJ56794.1 ATP-binding protein [Methanocorpusculum sp.]